jgi:phospholipase C
MRRLWKVALSMAAVVVAVLCLSPASAAAAISLSATPASVQTGSTITVQWSGAPAHSSAKDWVGMYVVGQTPGQVASTWWKYTGGAKSGSFTLAAPNPATYVFYYLLNNGYTISATSNTVTVTSSGGGGGGSTTLTLSPTTVVAGGAVSVDWTAPSGSSSTDWIGLYAKGAADTAYLWYQYTGGATSGTLHTTAQGASGTQFEFRYFLNNGYTKTATSNTGTATAIAPSCLASGQTTTNIKHLVVVVQENHTFDSYFANYCTAAPGSNPTCTTGPSCCETGPQTTSGHSPLVLNDAENAAYDPNHSQSCELSEIDNGAMDRFVTGASCSNPDNFAYSDSATMATYWGYAQNYAIADRCFQSAAGASSENDMYLARGAFVFTDNAWVPPTAGSGCYSASVRKSFPEPTVGDLLEACSVSWSFYAEGYSHALANPTSSQYCYPNYYDPSDNPFEYYPPFQDDPTYEKDYSQFATDIANGTLPAVSFVKPLGIKTEHPGENIGSGVAFVSGVVNAVLGSAAYADDTLVLLTYDESGGFFDHVAPPPASTVDGQAYGPRIPLVAVGYFARPDTVSHVPLEHSSIVRFIEYNWLAGTPGQLATRDAVVNNIGSLLDPAKTGVTVP